MTRPARLHPKAFTLVELLVVMGIMLMLLAMLLPAFSVVKRVSNSTVCTNNLRQIGVSLEVYAQLNNGAMPSQYETWGWGYWNEWDTLPAWPTAQCWSQYGNFLDYSAGALVDQCGATQSLFSCPGSNMYGLSPGDSTTGFGGYWAWIVYKGQKGSLTWPCTYQFYTPFAWGYSGGYNLPNGPFWVGSWGGKVPLGNKLSFYSATQYPAWTSSQYPTWVNLKADDVSNAPIASDLCLSTGWAVYYSHGTQLDGSKSNVLYADGHVDTDTIRSSQWFEYSNTWGTIFHYR